MSHASKNDLRLFCLFRKSLSQSKNRTKIKIKYRSEKKSRIEQFFSKSWINCFSLSGLSPSAPKTHICKSCIRRLSISWKQQQQQQQQHQQQQQQQQQRWLPPFHFLIHTSEVVPSTNPQTYIISRILSLSLSLSRSRRTRTFVPLQWRKFASEESDSRVENRKPR